ncbi:MAG: DMT family transporter [Coriobacteriia bacterium]|nr:DMT family transporter [Coriobacteriia bacterium]
MQRKAALVAVITSSACFATLAVLTRLAYAEGARPLPLLVWRFTIAATLLGGYLLVRQRRALLSGLRDVPRYAALSLTGYGAASICFFFALQHASASIVTVLLYAYPAIVAVLGAILGRERIGLKRVMAIVLTFLGCALAVGILDSEVVVNTLGVVFALGAALGYALFTLLSERLVADRPRLVLMAYTFALSALGIGVLASVTGEQLSPVGLTPALWGLLAAIVVLPTFLAVLLFLGGVRVLGAPQAALVSTMEPVFTILLAILLLGERLSLAQSAGAALVIGGIVLSEWPSSAERGPALI